MLYKFLGEHQKEILAMTAAKSLELAGVRPNSNQLMQGLPIFYKQLMTVLKLEIGSKPGEPKKEISKMATAATKNDEVAMASAEGRPAEMGLAASAGSHGKELFRLGYTLSHVVHAYGAMCQSITELATIKKATITADEFHDLNRCLDVAIAGAVTEFQTDRDIRESDRENKQLGFLAHEMRNALGTVTLALELIKDGAVGFGGSTGLVLDRGIKRIEQLIDRSLTEVRLRVDPKIHLESINLLQLIDQIAVTAGIEARNRKQILEIEVDSSISFKADQQLIYSAVSNLIQNALKYTQAGGKITVRGTTASENVFIEVEDECGGLTGKAVDLFRAFEQQNENRSGLGLGLTIAKQAAELHNGKISVSSLPQKGCIFKLTLPIYPTETTS